MTSCVLAFNGERLDPVSETYHLGNGYRAYSPVLMRFTSPDSWSPFGAGGVNPYAYCAGDPVNRADPSGHMSWQAGLGIGLGILGILGAIFTGGASIAAAASISTALAGASTISLVVGTAALGADVTGIASAATEESNPQASAALGWISLAFGILSLGAGLAGRMVRQGTKTVAAASRNIDGYAPEQIAAWDRVATKGLRQGGLLGGGPQISPLQGLNRIERSDWPHYLYHYTNQKRYSEMLAGNYINPSFKSIEGKNFMTPSGVYATGIKPNSMEPKELAWAILGSNQRSTLIEKTYYYFKLETANFSEGTSIFRSEDLNVYLIRTDARDLSVRLRTTRPANRPPEFMEHDILGRHGRSSEYLVYQPLI